MLPDGDAAGSIRNEEYAGVVELAQGPGAAVPGILFAEIGPIVGVGIVQAGES